MLQRFISEDPIGFAGGDVNLYAYTFNSPTNFTDPSGEIIPLLPLVGACLGGAAFNVTLDVGVNSLLGGKSGGQLGTDDLVSSAALGCVSGVAGFGLGKTLGLVVPSGAASQALVGTLRNRAIQLIQQGRLVGTNPVNIRTIATGRLRGFTAVDTTTTGGATTAQTLFRTVAGRNPVGSFDRVILDNGLEVLFRGTSRTGTPKVEIVNPAVQTLEKITFLP